MKSNCAILLSLMALCIHNSCKNKTVPLQKTNKPNVLFIIADDLNCDLNVYGHQMVASPNLDLLSESGAIFENAHCQYPLCGPSRASIMTGLYPDQTKHTDNRIYLRQTLPDVVTIGQKFREVGYNSVRIGKIYHYDNPSSLGTSSFDDVYTWDYVYNPYGIDKKEEHKIHGIVENWHGGDLSWYASAGSDAEQTDGISAQHAVEELEKFAANGENFFLAVGLYRPHVPFVAPKKYFERYKKSQIDVPQSDAAYLTTIPQGAARTIRAKKNQINLDEDTAKTVIQAYYASNTFVDAQVGKILNTLKETGLDRNTIVVFTSDHGYHMGEHGHYQKMTLFDNATRVPLLLSGPGIPKDSRFETPVELIDLYPTLMQLTGHETPEFVQGQNLTTLFDNPADFNTSGALTQIKANYSLKTDSYRITRWENELHFDYELYDTENDPEEYFNLAEKPEFSHVLDSLKRTLETKIAWAKKKPKGIGLQIDGVKPVRKPRMKSRLTPKNGQD